MAKQTKQQQWLNVIIISISALVLAFVLLGRFMNVSSPTKVEEPKNTGAASNIELRELDFGSQRLVLVKSSLNQLSDYVWQAIPNDSITQQETIKLISNWKLLLTETVDAETNDSREVISGVTVLLYFTDLETPVLVRVKEQTEQYLIQFISTGQIVIIEKSPTVLVLPVNLSSKVKLENE